MDKTANTLVEYGPIGQPQASFSIPGERQPLQPDAVSVVKAMNTLLHHLRRRWRHYLPLAVIAAAGITIFLATGLHEELTFDALALRYGALESTIAEAPLLSAVLALVFYVAFVVLAVPGVWVLSIFYGLLFGWFPGLPLILAGATLGASILYWASRTVLSAYFRERAGPVLNKLAEGFRQNAASYLLFLRFAPLFPFIIINVAPGLFGVSYRTFLWTTLVGILPASLVYAYTGDGLSVVVEERAQACLENVPPCGEGLSPFDILTPQILLAFSLLALLSLTPVLLRRLKMRQ